MAGRKRSFANNGVKSFAKGCYTFLLEFALWATGHTCNSEQGPGEPWRTRAAISPGSTLFKGKRSVLGLWQQPFADNRVPSP